MTLFVGAQDGSPARTEVEVEVVSQEGNSTTVRYRVYVNKTRRFVSDEWWYVAVHTATASGKLVQEAAGRTLVKNWTEVTVAHDTDGSKSISVVAQSQTFHPKDLGGNAAYPKASASWVMVMPVINRLPGAPPSIAAEVSLASIIATPAEAAANGGAPITRYEVMIGFAAGGEEPMRMVGNAGMFSPMGLLGTKVSFVARAHSVVGAGPWSAVSYAQVPALLGYRSTDSGEVACQTAERHLGDGQWVPCEAVERFNGTAWVQPV